MWDHFHRCSKMRRCTGPMIHRLSTWMPLITALEVVKSRCLGSVSPGMAVGTCSRPSRCGWPTSMSWDEPPSLRDA
jgi:hypothetical protein